MNNQNKPELTIGDLVTINFALSEKEDKIRSLIAEYPDKNLGKYLDEIKALQIKIKQLLAITPARTSE